MIGEDLTEHYANYWVTALLTINFNATEGPYVSACYPKAFMDDNPVITTNISILSFPESIESCISQDLIYNFNLASYHCYCSFRQVKDELNDRKYHQQSIVLVSTHAFGYLYNQILSRLNIVFKDIPVFDTLLNPSIIAEKSTVAIDNSNGELFNILSVCFSHFNKWPLPSGAVKLKLPFYGIMLDIQPPLSDPTINIANLHYSEIINTQVILRLGLLKYLWNLYDILVIKKEQIVIYSPSPAVVSSVINAIMTLFHQRSGSLLKCKPYTNAYDPEFTRITSTVTTPTIDLLHGEETPTVTYSLIGITNPFLLKSFHNKYNLLLLNNPDIEPEMSIVKSIGHSIGSLFNIGSAKLGRSTPIDPLRDSNQSCIFSPIGIYHTNVRHSNKYCHRVHRVNRKMVAAESLEQLYNEWYASGIGSHGSLYVRSPLILSNPDNDVVDSIKSLSIDGKTSANRFDCDICIVGSNIIHNHFLILHSSINELVHNNGNNYEALMNKYNKCQKALPKVLRLSAAEKEQFILYCKFYK